nr:4Fe-4S binding protein [Desulfobacula sp.]
MLAYFDRKVTAEAFGGKNTKAYRYIPVHQSLKPGVQAALTLGDGPAAVDENWCIGCGVCALKCDFDAVRIIYRKDQNPVPTDFKTLHTTIRRERTEDSVG